MSESQRELLADDALVLHVKTGRRLINMRSALRRSMASCALSPMVPAMKKYTWQIAAALCQSAY